MAFSGKGSRFEFVCSEKGRPLFNQLGWNPKVYGVAQSVRDMKHRIEELVLLTEFSVKMGSILDPDQLMEAAYTWLEDSVGWEVPRISTTGVSDHPTRYHVLGLDVCISDIRQRLDVELDNIAINSSRSFTSEVNLSEGIILFHFQDGTPILPVSRGSLYSSQFSEEFVSGVVGAIARSLSNAREFVRLKSLSVRDHLTGLYNRRFFEGILEVESLKRTSNPFSLLFIDLDNLKPINDSHGHNMGDEVLIALANRLHESFRKSDIPARYGGDEFAVMLPDASLGSAQRVAERFRDSVEALSFHLGDDSIKPTVSIGIATITDRKGLGMARIVEVADQALYQAKKGGRNRVCAVLL